MKWDCMLCFPIKYSRLEMTTESVGICSALCLKWNVMQYCGIENCIEYVYTDSAERWRKKIHTLAPNNFYHKCAYFSIPAFRFFFEHLSASLFRSPNLFEQFYYVRSTNGLVASCTTIFSVSYWCYDLTPSPSTIGSNTFCGHVFIINHIFICTLHIATYKNSSQRRNQKKNQQSIIISNWIA